MLEVKSTVNCTDVEALQTAVEVAHDAYSSAHERFEAAEATLGAAAGVRLGLVQYIESNRKLARGLCHSAIENAIRGLDGFKTAAARLVEVQSEGVLLGIALKKFTAYDFADSQRASLTAKLEMLETQHASETARLEHHIGQIHLSLGAAARRNGTIKVEMGGAVDARKRLCYGLAREADAVRDEIKRHDDECRALRDAYEKENQ